MGSRYDSRGPQTVFSHTDGLCWFGLRAGQDAPKPAQTPNDQPMRETTNRCAREPSQVTKAVWCRVAFLPVSPEVNTVCSTGMRLLKGTGPKGPFLPQPHIVVGCGFCWDFLTAWLGDHGHPHLERLNTTFPFRTVRVTCIDRIWSTATSNGDAPNTATSASFPTLIVPLDSRSPLASAGETV